MGNSQLRVLLFSGGIDSTALAWWLQPEFLLTIDYGQKTATAEIKAAQILALELSGIHKILKVDLSSIGSGSLAGTASAEIAPEAEWWPFRNQLLITIGAAWAASNDVGRILIGSVKTDSRFSDGTEEFISRMSGLLSHQEGRICVDAPAIQLDCTELVLKSKMPPSLLLHCFSCGVSAKRCGKCRSCHKYQEVLTAFGLL